MSDQAYEQNNVDSNDSRNNRTLYYCHQCHSSGIEPLMAPYPTCPNCNSDFLEEIEEDNDPRDFVEHGGGHETDEEYEDNTFTTGNPPSDIYQVIQNLVTFFQSGPNSPIRVQTETRGDTTTTTITTAQTTTVNEQQEDSQQDQQDQQRPNIIFAMGSGTADAGDGRAPTILGIAQMIARAIENGGGASNTTNFFNLFNMAADPREYAWGSTGLDNIISQLMEQQAGRQAPPPATDEIINNLPKTKITKQQVVEEQLSCPVCKDEFKIDEEVLYLPCTHTFHGGCIAPWLKVNGTCPVCRYSLVSEGSNQRNDQNRNNGAGSSANDNSNESSASAEFRFNTNSSFPGAYPSNQSNDGQQNRQDDYPYESMDLDSESLD